MCEKINKEVRSCTTCRHETTEMENKFCELTCNMWSHWESKAAEVERCKLCKWWCGSAVLGGVNENCINSAFCNDQDEWVAKDATSMADIREAQRIFSEATCETEPLILRCGPGVTREFATWATSHTDAINPGHYQYHPVETCELVEALVRKVGDILTPEQIGHFHTAMYYRMRAGIKEGNPAEEDIAKALWHEARVKELAKTGQKIGQSAS